MLTLNQVAYRWPDAAADCLHAISLELRDGEWLALTGDNGAGKSTLLRIMAGLLSPTSGSVTLNGEPIAQLKNRQRAAAIGVLFQEAENQIFHSNVAQEVAFGLKLQRLSAEEISRRTQATLRLCQLTDVAEAHPLDLHAAQRRMVAVASLEAMAPPVLLLDEPSRDFDAHWQPYLNTGWRHAGYGEPASWRLAMTLRLPGVIFHGWYGWKTAGCQRGNKKRVAEATRFMPY